MRPSALPLAALATFVEAARAESFTVAAKALFVTPGAVSRQMRALERELEVPLFTRTARAVILTPAGRAYLVEVTRAFEVLTRAQEALGRGASRLVVSLLPSFASLWLMPRLPRFEARHPDLSIELRPAYEHVDLREVDAAIRYRRGPYPGVTARRLLDETLVPVASPAVAKRLRGGSFWHLPLLSAGALDEAGEDLDWRAWAEGTKVEVPRSAKLRRLRDYQRVVHAARAGQGIAVGRLSLVAPLLEERALVPVARDRVTGATAHFFVCREEAWRLPAVKRFYRWLSREGRPRA
jgi:LysR family glycine cleavage system transcriptional activator